MVTGLGEDVKEVFMELGTPFVIVNRLVDEYSEQEKVIYELNAQATKPFIREHHLDATFAYDTEITVEDVIYLSKTDKHYLVMNKTPEMFEGEVVEWSSVLYLCNLPENAVIVRPIEVRDPETYKVVVGWQKLHENRFFGLMTDRIFGSKVEQDTAEGQTLTWRIDLYVPKSYNVKPLDRLIVSPTEYYKIEEVEGYYYPGMNVCMLVEDTRPRTVFEEEDEYGDEYDG